MKKENINTFSEGLNYDVNPITTPNNILTDNVNGTFITFNGDELALQNDAGNTTIDTKETMVIAEIKYGALYNLPSLINSIITTGEIEVHKIVTSNNSPIIDNTNFELEIIGPLGTTYETISQDNPLILTNLPFGEYTINETIDLKYTIDSIIPNTFILNESNWNQSIEIINNVCTEEIACQCVISFDEYTETSLSVLTVGNLIGSPCIFDEYVIDWYRNGNLELISGVGSDPEIEVFHPFVGLASIPVLPGTWIPIVRYVVIDGVRIYRDEATAHSTCDDWCSTLNNLPVIIVVSPIDCASRSVAEPYYNYKITYTSTQDFGLAYRKFVFSLPTDSAIKYLALYFKAYDVADKIEIFWNDDVVPIESIIVGTRFNHYDENASPKLVNYNGLQFLINVEGHIPGDYIRFEITPSVLEVNVNTNWDLSIACLDSTIDFPDGNYSTDMRILDSVQVTEGSDCQLNFVFTPHQASTSPSPTGFMSNWYKYLGWKLWPSYIPVNSITGAFSTTYSNSVTHYQLQTNVGGIFGTSRGNINYKKTGAVIVVTCDDVDDYNSHKTGYNFVEASSLFASYIEDNTRLEYFMYRRWQIQIAAVSCGDTSITKQLYIHRTATFTFNDVLQTITITTVPIVNGVTPIPCDSGWSTCNSAAAYINATSSELDYEYNTRCTLTTPLGLGIGIDPIGHNPPARSILLRHSKNSGIGLPREITLATRLSDGTYSFPMFYLLIQTTGLPAIDNYRISKAASLTGGAVSTIYEVINGIITTNLLPI